MIDTRFDEIDPHTLSEWHRDVIKVAFPLGFKETARSLIEKAKTIEDKITSVVTNAVSRFRGRMEGLEHKLKKEDSLSLKLQRYSEAHDVPPDEAIAYVWDVLRYTAVFEPLSYANGVQGVIDTLSSEGFNVAPDRFRNFWANPKDSYNAVNAVFNSPFGLPFECQFHTDESIRIKEANHSIYKAYKSERDPRKRRELWDQMVGNWDGVWIPNNVNSIGLPFMETFEPMAAASVANAVDNTLLLEPHENRIEFADGLVLRHVLTEDSSTVERFDGQGWKEDNRFIGHFVNGEASYAAPGGE